MRINQLPAIIVLIIMLVPVMSVIASDESPTTSGRESTIEVSELFQSPNRLVSNATSSNVYGAVDWNSDGDYGTYSDQFIELWNTGSTPVNVSDWKLSTTSGSPPCQLAWNTVIDAGARIVVFSADSDIILNYWESETVSVADTSGAVVDSITIPEEFGFYGNSIVEDSSGSLIEVTPTPGWGPNDPDSSVALNIVNCYKVADTSSADAFILKGRVVTMEGENSVMNQGNVLVRDNMIDAVWSSSSSVPLTADLTNVPVIETNGTIYPGLIDLHNHMHYNHIPLWDFQVHLNDEQKSAEGGYSNRGQWGGNYDYGPSITWMKNNVQDNKRWGMATEQMKYAEVQAIAGGVTAVQGSPSGNDAWDSTLSRNVELWNFGKDNTVTCAVCSWYESSYNSNGKIADFNDGDIEAWFIHMSEGVDQTSRDEFDLLKSKGLLAEPTVVIHGTALTPSQFQSMGVVGSNLVWSPLSNLLLYGNTTDVRAADNAGVKISLAPDWGPSGSKNNMHELKVADLWNSEVMDSYFTNYQMVEMVTTNPAAAAEWQDHVGQIKAGMVADLVVIDTFHDDPYRNLIESIDADVRLTVVNGKALFGDQDIMTALKGDDWEPITGGGVSKALDITSSTVVDGSQTWAEIEAGMAMAMRNDVSDIREHWTAPEGVAWSTDTEVQSYLNTEFDGKNRVNAGVSQLRNMTVDPIFTTGDERYFDVINRSSWANTHIDLSLLYSYYDISMDENGDRTGANVVLPGDEANTGGTDNTGGNSDGTDNTDNTGGTDNTDGVTLCPDGTAPPCTVTPPVEDDTSSDTETVSNEGAQATTKMLLIAMVAVIGIGLYVLGKSKGEELDLAGEARIEKIWDETELEETELDGSTEEPFVPAPPPMAKTESKDDDSGDVIGEEKNNDPVPGIDIIVECCSECRNDFSDCTCPVGAQDHNTTRSNRATKHDKGDGSGGNGSEKSGAQDHNTTRSNRN
ncbi:MAG: amidohydrolase family protein [Candidatus Poseidoniales archaeon]